MKLCDTCAKFGTIVTKIASPEPKKAVKTEPAPITRKGEFIQLIVPDFAQRIKNAREKRGMKQEEFAKSIAEKESVIHNLESGRIRPGIELARKLEKALQITLVEQVEDKKGTASTTSSDDTMTLGDLLK